MAKKDVTNLSLKTLEECGFRIVNLAFQKELAAVVADMQSRPGDKKDRVITLDFVFSPVDAGSAGMFSGAALTVKCQSKVPKVVIAPKMFFPNNKGGLTPNDPDQQVMEFDEEPKELNERED